MKLFLAYIRSRYSLSTNEWDSDFVNRLSAKSDIPETIINKILMYHNNIKNSSFVSEQTLIEFHLEIDKFYKHCK